MEGSVLSFLKAECKVSDTGSVDWASSFSLWFVILSLLLRELKKGETFASLLNIHSGDIRVVPTHLVINTEPSIHVDASYQVSVHMAKQFQRRRFFRNWPIRNKNCMWWPCLLIDRDEMSNLQRGHSIDASYQVSVVAIFVNRWGRNEQSQLLI
jgi:hypothetical protein